MADHGVVQSAKHLRKGNTPLLVPAGGATLIKTGPELKVVRVWLDGATSVDYDMPEKYLAEHLRKSFDALRLWKNAQEGHVLAPWDARARPPDKSWHPFKGGGRFWWKGPLEALVFGTQVSTPADVGPAQRFTPGAAHLQATGGKVAYRVGSYFTVREHLAEVPV